MSPMWKLFSSHLFEYKSYISGHLFFASSAIPAPITPSQLTVMTIALALEENMFPVKSTKVAKAIPVYESLEYSDPIEQ